MSPKRSHWRSIRTRVTLFTLAIFVISIWCMAFYASRILRQDMQHLLGEQQFATIDIVAAQVDAEFRLRLTGLELVAGEIGTKLMSDQTALQERIGRLPLLQALFNGGVFVTGADGAAIADVPLSAGRLGTNYLDRDSVSIPLKEGRTVVGAPAMGKKLGAPIFSMVAPIRDGRGAVIGTLVGTVNLGMPNFLDRLTQSRYGKTGGYLLAAPQHKLFVTATDKTRIMQPMPAPGVNAMHDRYMQGYEGFGLAVSSHGVLELSAAKGIPAAGWFLVVTLPATEAFAPIDGAIQRLLVSALFLTVLAGALVWWLITWMLREQLATVLAASRALPALEASDPAVQTLPVVRQDEIGELIGGFNHLLETLRRREQELLHKQVMLARTERAAHLGSWEWDAATDTVTWSDEMFRLFQRDPKEGAPSFAQHSALYIAQDMERLKEAVNAALNQGTPYELELRAIRKDGMERVCLAQGYAQTGSDKKVTFLFGSLQDITERKRAVLELEQHRHHLEALVQERTLALSIARQAAEAANRAKATFLATISHELRTPMNAIMGMTALALRRATDPRQMEQLTAVTQSSRNLLALINHILDYSSLESERFTLEENDFRLEGVIENLVRMRGPQAADKGLALVTEMAPALGRLPLRGDARCLGQVLGHLTSNAIKFSSEGQVTVSVSVADESPADVLVRVEVRDMGIGISADVRKRLFTAFEQADGSLTRKYEGTGLGLALSKRLVQVMGGSIGVDSTPGSGSTFWFTVRLTKVA